MIVQDALYAIGMLVVTNSRTISSGANNIEAGTICRIAKARPNPNGNLYTLELVEKPVVKIYLCREFKTFTVLSPLQVLAYRLSEVAREP